MYTKTLHEFEKRRLFIVIRYDIFFTYIKIDRVYQNKMKLVLCFQQGLRSIWGKFLYLLFSTLQECTEIRYLHGNDFSLCDNRFTKIFVNQMYQLFNFFMTEMSGSWVNYVIIPLLTKKVLRVQLADFENLFLVGFNPPRSN